MAIKDKRESTPLFLSLCYSLGEFITKDGELLNHSEADYFINLLKKHQEKHTPDSIAAININRRALPKKD